MTRYTPQWLQAGGYAASQDRRLLSALWPGPASTGCQVTAGGGMALNVAAGQVAVPSQNSTGATLCSSDAVEQVTLPAAPPSGTNRIDLVTCHPRGNDLDGGSNNDFIFDSVQGTPATTPTVPATPAGQVALAQVYVTGGAAAIVAANITDVRPFGLAIAAAASLPPPVSTGTAVQSFVDGNGQTWVAKNGVNGGNWRLARDVLHARMYRAAAFTWTTSWVTLAYDTVDRDPYGIWVAGSTGFVLPVTGLYLLTGNTSVAPVASTVYQHNLLLAGAAIGSSALGAVSTWGVTAPFAVEVYGTAGQVVQVQISSSSGTANGQAGRGQTGAGVAYLGSG